MKKADLKIIALSQKETFPLIINGLTTIGGSAGSGIQLSSLSHSGDYAVIVPSNEGITVQALRGQNKKATPLKALQHIVIEDLILLTLPAATAAASLPPFRESFLEQLLTLIHAFAQPGDLTAALNDLLKAALRLFSMQSGLLAIKTLSDDYEIVAQEGLDTSEPWLSETLIEDAIKSPQGIFIQNVFGSGYDSNKSLMATGFISVFAWPLIVRDQCQGVLMVGSRKPHSGLIEQERLQAQTLVQVAALILFFYLRDLSLKRELEHFRNQTKLEDYPLLTQNEELLETCRLAKRVAQTDLAVLIQGETGVGKEVLANWIHAHSDRREKPFVTINCGAIPTELLESILFGHRKGSFTGAVNDQIGKFQQANGGTLFLDEIGDLPELMQVKLLRVLQEKVVEPLGAQRSIAVDVRIVAASHKQLPQLIQEKKFREDLYYRLAEMTLQIPALRDRPQDVDLLATSLLKRVDSQKRFSADAREWLRLQPWKGNVRELISAIKRAAILAPGSEITAKDFLHGQVKPNSFSTENSWLGGENLEEAKNRFVIEKVQTALRLAGGKRARAAELLGVTPRTLFRYLEESRTSMTDLSVDTDTDVTV